MMHNARERLTTAQWMLERQLHWISAADVKVGVAIALNTAMLGGLAAAYASTSDHNGWAIAMCVLSLFLSGSALFCTAMAVFPRLDGPPDSLLFFGRVSVTKSTDYVNKLITVTDDELLRDWGAQIHINARIAAQKHGWVKFGVLWAFFSTPFWIAAIAFLIKY